jgi:phospholipase A1/A2
MKKLIGAGAVAQILLICAVAGAQTNYLAGEQADQTDPFPIQPLFADSTAAAPQTASPPLVPTTSPDVTPGTQPTATPSATYSATHPEQTSADQGQFPGMGSAFGLGEFFNHFAPYEPVYIVGGAASPNVKFQFSIRYRIFTPTGPMATEEPWLKGFNIAYSQMSLWDLNSSSPFFFDSSYRPEFFYYLENIKGALPGNSQLGFQAGVGHESNGRGGVQERSLNILYIRPIVDIPLNSDQWFLTFAPKLYTYVGSLSDNPDIAKYRGYADIRVVFGQRDGIQLAALGRIGNEWNRGSIQVDLTYPLTKIFHGNADVSLDLQYFRGFDESLLTYNQRTEAIRLGIAIVR